MRPAFLLHQAPDAEATVGESQQCSGCRAQGEGVGPGGCQLEQRGQVVGKPALGVVLALRGRLRSLMASFPSLSLRCVLPACHISAFTYLLIYKIYLFYFWLHRVFIAVRGLLTAVASLVAEHGL